MRFPPISEFPVISLDTETTGLNWQKDKIFGISISTPDGKDFYYDIRLDNGVVPWLRDELPECKKVVNHNIKFDLHMLWSSNIFLQPAACECTMIRAALLDEHLMQYSLDFLAKKYLKAKKVDDIYEKLASLFGGRPTRNAQMKNISKAPKSIVEPYAKMDSRLALNLWMEQEKMIEKQGIEQVWSFENQLFPHIFKNERHGIRVDVDLAQKTAKQLTIEINKIQKQLNQIAGFEVNPNPSGSIHKLFNPQYKNKQWVANDGTILPETPAGKASIGALQLQSMTHPGASLILECRKFMKTRDTFINSHILGYVHNNRVHPNINQTKGDSGGTGTGRLSYNSPALQQIPARDKKIAGLVRPIFLPDEGQGWSYGDLDQHEFRVFAHYVNSDRLINAYKKNPDLDFHQIIADLAEIPRNPAKEGGPNAKQMNLAMVFNMGGGKLAEMMGLPYTTESFTNRNGEVFEYKKPGEKTEQIIKKYHEAVPGVKELAKNASSVAKTRGYVRTLKGRHIRFPGGNFVHKASGLVYQGTSADLNKDCIIRISEYLESECPDGHLLLNIHDEFSVSIPVEDEKRHLCNLKQLVQDRPEIRIPIRIDFSETRGNWWDATNANKITP